MSSPRVSNYLRASRKRLAFSQGEVAYLLGTETGEKVCRHELFLQVPDLEVALAYEVIFQRPVRELFGGLFARIQEEVVARAKALTGKEEPDKLSQRGIRKRQALADLAGAELPEPQHKS